MAGPSGGWRLGVQCKKYLLSNLSRRQLKERGAYSNGTNTDTLLRVGRQLRKGGRRKRFALFYWNAFLSPGNSQERGRLDRLLRARDSWHSCVHFDNSEKEGTDYRLTLGSFSEFVKTELSRAV